MSFIIHAQNKLNILSNIVDTFNIGIKFKFNYLKNLDDLNIIPINQNNNDLFLLLFINDINVSTIQCTLKRNFMYISSKTHKDHLNKKYNLLLRCVIILIIQT